MILAKLVGVTLLWGVATGPTVEAPIRHLSVHQKNAAARSYVESATNCIARTVAADKRFRAEDPSNLGDLIVDSVPKCLVSVRAMIGVYDQYFGEGAGENFFMGPYLDVLPNAVVKLIRDKVD